MRRPMQGNVFGGFDEVRVARSGRARATGLHTEAVQLNLLTGEPEPAVTLRNPWNEEREADDARKGLVAK